MRELLLSPDAAHVVMTVAPHADKAGQVDLARQHYRQAIDLYTAAHSSDQADTARARLDASQARQTTTGHTPSR
ncbi:hypothetical protein AOZ06_16020 [Kibdelosporangium phytohabitans]|uniref:Tetratricopeptide repeat protein n=1 Tax=Kibdelosporangium phytohabitans TaxID=860235 RepID=A0A0N7F3C1_9PSEU|nr:hypothetical protein AOZ06_16020 [Kibdelosporangium phytohabitans]